MRYLEWSWDPDPDDPWTQTEYAFILRDTDGSIRVVHESHRFGLFTTERWMSILRDAGFDAQAVTDVTSEDRVPRTFFVGHRLVAP